VRTLERSKAEGGAQASPTERRFAPHIAITIARPKHDPAKLLERFETAQQVVERQGLLAAALEGFGEEGKRLGKRLRRCGSRRNDGLKCLSAADPECLRDMRRWATDQACRLRREGRRRTGHRGTTVTVIPAGLRAEPGRLYEISIIKVRQAWWRAVHRMNITLPIYGGIDISFNEDARTQEPGHYQVHFAFAILGHANLKEAHVALKRRIEEAFDLEPMAARPVRVDPIRNPMRQLSYLYKAAFFRRVSIVGRGGRADTMVRPLKAKHLAEIALWLDRGSLTDRLLLYGLRRQGGRIVSTVD
jgi:hypothetical protein